MVTVPALGSKGVITEEELDNSGIVDWILEGDHYKEADRMYRRPVFGANDWKKHRSSGRITYNLSNLFSSRIFRMVVSEVLLVALMALLATVYYDPVFAAFAKDIFRDPSWKPFTISMTPFNLTSFSLSLLLVFKTNSAYARWWEARIIWGGIVNTSQHKPRHCAAVLVPFQAEGQPLEGNHDRACIQLLSSSGLSPQ